MGNVPGIPASTKHGEIYDLKNIKEIAIREKLTPAQFEDLVDRSGAVSNSPEIEKIRTEVYSKFPSYTYQLEREFIRGYDKTWQNMVDSIVHQAELYGSSFYSLIGGEEALKGLEKSKIEKSDPNLYKLAMRYIKDETQPSEFGWLEKKATTARKFVYFWQLAYDVNQLWLNAVAQPITQTYGYFSRLEYNGIRLTGLEPEQYWIRGQKLMAQARTGKAPTEFQNLTKQLEMEHVLTPVFTKDLAGIDSSPSESFSSKTKSIPKKIYNNWAGVFMQEGERITRTHAAAEAYLIGKEKFKLSGDDLIKFMVRAVDATQTNPTRGENPYVVRRLGEGGKLIYQFMAFNQMWWENLAIGVKQSQGAGRKSAFLARELVPLALMGGIKGLPLTAFAATLYSIITGDDPKKKLDKILKKDSMIEQLALYGFSTSAGLSSKIGPQFPVLDNFGESVYGNQSLSDHVPIFATGKQIGNGFKDLLTAREGYKRLRGAENSLPRAIRGPIRVIELAQYGVKTSGGDTIISHPKVKPWQYIGQAINIPQNKVIEHYEQERYKKIRKQVRKFKTIRKMQQVF